MISQGSPLATEHTSTDIINIDNISHTEDDNGTFASL